MAHPNWCGKTCGECSTRCKLDESMTCSPDCSDLNSITGEPDGDYCTICDALSEEEE